MSNILAGRQPRHETLVNIQAATNVSWVWLMKGEGEMFIGELSEPSEDYNLSGSSARVSGNLLDQETIMLPWLDVAAIASFEQNVSKTLTKIATTKEWRVIKMAGHVYDKAFVMDVVGPSMIPTYKPGDKAIIREVSRGRWEYSHGVHAISLKGGTFTLKRIVGNVKNGLVLKADNPDTPTDMTIELADILLMFKAGEIVYRLPED